MSRLLRVASSENRNLPIEKEDINAYLLIEQAINKVQPPDRTKKCKNKVEGRRHAADASLVHADKAHLELAVVNLLENALKYSPDPHIVVESGNAENDFFISVKGQWHRHREKIPEKYLSRNFTACPPADVHNVKGFGLGLNFVKRIIDAHDGKIKVNSLPGIGTEFRLLIPFN